MPAYLFIGVVDYEHKIIRSPHTRILNIVCTFVLISEVVAYFMRKAQDVAGS